MQDYYTYILTIYTVLIVLRLNKIQNNGKK